MPTIYPFTPAGVLSKQADLYVLDDSDLLDEAKLIVADVEAWLLANFTLSVKQQAYVAAAPPSVHLSWGLILAAAINQRSEIEMAPVPTDYGPPRRTKEIMIGVSGDCNFFPPISGPGAATGTIKVSIQYRLVD